MNQISNPLLVTTLMLAVSNMFHDLRLVWASEKTWRVRHGMWRRWLVGVSRCSEYLLQVPANRIGYTELSLGQLKILQEVITLSVFVPFAVLYMDQPLKIDYLYAALCLMAAVYFIFRSA